MDSNLKIRLTENLQREKGVLAAYLIGSFAQNKERKTSDFDLAVVVDDRKSLNENKMYDLVRELSFPSDLDLSVVDGNSSPLFLYEIVSYGKLIFARDAAEAADFEAKVLHKFYDTDHIRKIYYSYLKIKFPYAT